MQKVTKSTLRVMVLNDLISAFRGGILGSSFMIFISIYVAGIYISATLIFFRLMRMVTKGLENRIVTCVQRHVLESYVAAGVADIFFIGTSIVAVMRPEYIWLVYISQFVDSFLYVGISTIRKRFDKKFAGNPHLSNWSIKFQNRIEIFKTGVGVIGALINFLIFAMFGKEVACRVCIGMFTLVFIVDFITNILEYRVMKESIKHRN